jgi:hypothetical protein
MMLNKIFVVVVALALAGAPISSLLAAAPSGGGGEPVSGGPVGAVPGVATGSTAKKKPIPTNRLRWTPSVGQVAKGESLLGTAAWPKVRHGKYTEEAQS